MNQAVLMTGQAAAKTASTKETTRARVTTANVVLCEFEETGIPGVESFSPFCTKVRMALAVAKVPFTSRRGARPTTFKALNPAAQLPILLVDDAIVADSTAILTRIELISPSAFDRHLDATTKAEAWLWEEMADTVLNGFLVASRWYDESNWPTVREAYFGAAPWFVRTLVAPKVRNQVIATLRARDVVRQGSDVLWRRFDETLDRLEARAPVADFWVADGLSRADLAIAAQLESLRTPLTPSQRTKVESRPKLTAYLDRVKAAVYA